jgi:D-sedoheptulose 7-phosphate isomerase
MMENYKQLVTDELTAHHAVITEVISQLAGPIQQACELVVNTLKNGNKVFLAGNGGSAADAQHIAAELTGRFVKERRALPGIALTTDTSALTAIANDYGFDQVFARQLKGLASPGDLFIGISTSGNSPNIIKAIEAAQTLNCRTLGLTGNSGGLMLSACDAAIVVPSAVTARIQEMHILIGHILCKAVDDAF